jgi:hypothetical protein
MPEEKKETLCELLAKMEIARLKVQQNMAALIENVKLHDEKIKELCLI